MSTAVLKLVSPPDSPVGQLPAGATGFLWLDEAANRAGVTEGQLRRRCPGEWFPAGLARKAERPNGQTAWQVHETADPRFARVKSPETLSAHADLSGLTDAQRDEVLRREKIVKGWDEAVAAGISLEMSRDVATKHYLHQLKTRHENVSRGTLYRWHGAWRKSGRAGLIDARWGAQSQAGDGEAEQLYRETLLGLWLDPRRRSLKLCHELASHELEKRGGTQSGCRVQPPSYTTAKRIAASVKPAVVTKKRQGKKAFEDKHAPFILRDYSSIDSNAWWCSDHYRMDVTVKVGEKLNPKSGELEAIYDRPWLHAWLDVRSRKCVGWALVNHDPNADLILRVVSGAMREHGAPVNAYIDNGDDYDARRLQGVSKKERRAGARPGNLSPAELKRIGGALPLLDVNVIHCWPYHGQSKPNEAWHRTIKDRFCRLYDTFTGGSTAEKPEDLAKQLKAGHAPTLDELRSDFAAWIRDGYNSRVHLGDSMHGKTPDRVYAECLHVKRTLPEELIRFACMPRVGPLKVRQNGVHYSDLSFNHPALDDHFGESVLLAIDVEDLKTAIVLDLEGRVICRAAVNEKLPWGAGQQELRQAIAAKQAATRAMTNYDRQRPRMALDAAGMMRAMSADKARALRAAPGQTPPVPPAGVAMVNSPIADELGSLKQTGTEGRSTVHRMKINGKPSDQLPAGATGFVYTRSVRDENEDE